MIIILLGINATACIITEKAEEVKSLSEEDEREETETLD